MHSVAKNAVLQSRLQFFAEINLIWTILEYLELKTLFSVHILSEILSKVPFYGMNAPYVAQLWAMIQVFRVFGCVINEKVPKTSKTNKLLL